MLSVQGGYDVGYLTGQVATARENYYLSSVASGVSLPVTGRAGVPTCGTP